MMRFAFLVNSTYAPLSKREQNGPEPQQCFITRESYIDLSGGHEAIETVMNHMRTAVLEEAWQRVNRNPALHVGDWTFSVVSVVRLD